MERWDGQRPVKCSNNPFYDITIVLYMEVTNDIFTSGTTSLLMKFESSVVNLLEQGVEAMIF